MKRTNIHLETDTTQALDGIAAKLNEGRWYRLYTRANLIRYAISKTFGFKSCWHDEDITKKLTELSLKKGTSEKRKTKRV